MRRRIFFKAAAATLIAVRYGEPCRALVAQAGDIPDGVEFEPWRTWQESGTGPLAIVRAAIISANAYNTQPWLFRVTDAAVEFHVDLRRNLGAFDPYCREMHFSLGCALENALIAARHGGYRPAVTFIPGMLTPPPADAKPELVARIELHRANPATARDPMFDAIPHRHTNRGLFDPARALPDDFVKKIGQLPDRDEPVKVFLFSDRGVIGRIADSIVSDSTAFNGDPDVERSTQKWFRNRDEMREHRDGILLELREESTPGPSYAEFMKSARLFGLIAVRDRYSREQTVRAGRIWQRAHLLATVNGIAARPANGSVELIDHERRLGREPQSMERLARFTGDAVWQPTFMFYMGYGTKPATASPRRPIDRVQM